MRDRIRIALAALLVSAATLAWAATFAQVDADATQLRLDELALSQDVESCENGECQEAAALVAEFEDLEERRSQLHADRATLEPDPGLPALDQKIAIIDSVAAATASTIDGWTGW
jgi:hypothetical protein